MCPVPWQAAIPAARVHQIRQMNTVRSATLAIPVRRINWEVAVANAILAILARLISVAILAASVILAILALQISEARGEASVTPVAPARLIRGPRPIPPPAILVVVLLPVLA